MNFSESKFSKIESHQTDETLPTLLTAPLSHYFIKSSSDTINRNGAIHLSNLVKTLKQNYRRVELLVSELYVGKTHSLICRSEGVAGGLKLEKCLKAIAQHSNLSMGPMILALKLDCDFQSQIMLAEVLEKYIGDKNNKLFKPKSKSSDFHSPNALKGKIVIAVEIQYEEKENGRLNMAERLQNLVYIEALGNPRVKTKVTSFVAGWSGTEEAWRSHQAKTAQLHKASKKTLMHIHASKDTNLFNLWYQGVQCITLPSSDGLNTNTRIYEALFKKNNGCGFVRKPHWMTSVGSILPEQLTSLQKQFLSITLGRMAAKKGSWQVLVTVVGCRASYEHKSTALEIPNSKAINVRKQRTWISCLATPQLSTMIVELKDLSANDARSVGYVSIPCDQVKEGNINFTLTSSSGNVLKYLVGLVVKWQ